jgi:1,2-diacylglycerol-3-alpha-glucose alpha-1,2-glucosyltransferase
MITGLTSLSKIVKFTNAGGMGTQVPILIDKLRERGVDVLLDSSERCDIIHLHNPMPNFLFTLKKAKNRGAKTVIHARHLPELVIGGFKGGNLIYPIFHRYSRYLYSQADAVVCATPYVKEWMLNNKVQSKFFVIPNGVNCKFFIPSSKYRDIFRETYGISDDDFVVLSVGLMIPRKGVSDFVEVARKCSNITFIWVGSVEKTMESVTLSYPENMIHIPYLLFEDMPKAYNGTDVFFFPTYAESYGNVLMEAAACKKPVVLRDIPIYKEWFTDGVNCLKGGTVDKFVNNIDMLKRDTLLREKIADAAYDTALTHSLDKTIDALIDMYERLLAE